MNHVVQIRGMPNSTDSARPISLHIVYNPDFVPSGELEAALAEHRGVFAMELVPEPAPVVASIDLFPTFLVAITLPGASEILGGVVGNAVWDAMKRAVGVALPALRDKKVTWMSGGRTSEHSASLSMQIITTTGASATFQVEAGPTEAERICDAMFTTFLEHDAAVAELRPEPASPAIQVAEWAMGSAADFIWSEEQGRWVRVDKVAIARARAAAARRGPS